jgi:hypothetical protein
VDGVRQHLGARQDVAQPATALRLGVRMRGDDADVLAASARAPEQAERHRQQHLAGHLQRLAVGQLVERGGHRSLDGVLQRHHRAVHLTGPDRLQRDGHGSVRHQIGPVGGRHAAQRGLGEGAAGPGSRTAQAGRRALGLPRRTEWADGFSIASCSSGDSSDELVPPCTPLA